MVEEQTTKIVTCDICKNLIQEVKVNKITIRGFDWHVCHVCQTGLQGSLTFLTIGVGLSIDYHWGTIDYKLLAGKNE